MVTAGADEPNKAIPFALADDGYDVWLFNARGNRYSKGHLWMDAQTEPEYWAFTFKEFANYDLPGALDFIQMTRKNDRKIKLIGWSQGTTTSFTAMILHDLSAQVDKMIALAPVVYFHHSEETILKKLAEMHMIWNIATDMGFFEVSDDTTHD
jgi:lysosomal acid lipase/cholesteryl ester hydrolase